jgi:hypothetical protein
LLNSIEKNSEFQKNFLQFQKISYPLIFPGNQKNFLSSFCCYWLAKFWNFYFEKSVEFAEVKNVCWTLRIFLFYLFFCFFCWWAQSYLKNSQIWEFFWKSPKLLNLPSFHKGQKKYLADVLAQLTKRCLKIFFRTYICKLYWQYI